MELSERDKKLLISMLNELSTYRWSMGCNDEYENERDLFTEEERIKIYEELVHDENGPCDCLNNANYVSYILNKLENK